MGGTDITGAQCFLQGNSGAEDSETVWLSWLGYDGCYDNGDGADIICNDEVSVKYELTEERHSWDFCAQTTTNLEMDRK